MMEHKTDVNITKIDKYKTKKEKKRTEDAEDDGTQNT